MKRLFTLMFLVATTLISCSKNQRQVNRIDGKWNVVEAEIKGYGTTDPDVIYEFEYGKLNHDEFCDFSVHNFDTDNVTSGIYTIENRGNTLAMTISDGFGYAYREYSIKRLGYRKMVLENPTVPAGEFSRIVLRRVK